MPLPDSDRLRMMLGERIPPDGADDDTMFTDAEIQDFLDQASGNVRAAAWLGWQAKADEFANMATKSEGNSSRSSSDLAVAAERRVKDYLPDAVAAGIVASAGRVKIGKIVRSGGSI